MIEFSFQPSRNTWGGHRVETCAESLPESLLTFVTNASMQIKNLINIEENMAEKDTKSLYSSAIPSPNASYFYSSPSPTFMDDQEVPSLSPKPVSRKMSHRPPKTRRSTSRNHPYVSPVSSPTFTSFERIPVSSQERAIRSPNSLTLPKLENSFISVEQSQCNGSFYQDAVQPKRSEGLASFRKDHESKKTVCSAKEKVSSHHSTPISPCPDLEDLLDFMLAEDCMSPDFFLHSLMAL